MTPKFESAATISYDCSLAVVLPAVAEHSSEEWRVAIIAACTLLQMAVNENRLVTKGSDDAAAGVKRQHLACKASQQLHSTPACKAVPEWCSCCHWTQFAVHKNSSQRSQRLIHICLHSLQQDIVAAMHQSQLTARKTGIGCSCPQIIT
jgi:hypothetical protein